MPEGVRRSGTVWRIIRNEPCRLWAASNLDVGPASGDNGLADVGRTYGRGRVRQGCPDERAAVVFAGYMPNRSSLGKENAPEWRNWQTRGTQNPVWDNQVRVRVPPPAVM